MKPWIRSLWNILPFEMSENMLSGIFSGFDICNLKLFPIKNRSSIVRSLQNIKNMQFLTILMSKKCNFRKNVEIQFWPVLKYVKNYAEFESAIHFAWNLQKWRVFDNCHFWYFPYFCIFLYFWGRRHEALAFKFSQFVILAIWNFDMLAFGQF